MIASQMRTISEKAETMMRQECEALNAELHDRFVLMLQGLTQEELNSLIVEALF